MDKMKALTEEQKWLYKKIMKLGHNKKVVKMSYEDLFLTLDRVKFAYFLDYLCEEKGIKLTDIIKPKTHLTDEELGIKNKCRFCGTKLQKRFSQVLGTDVFYCSNCDREF